MTAAVPTVETILAAGRGASGMTAALDPPNAAEFEAEKGRRLTLR